MSARTGPALVNSSTAWVRLAAAVVFGTIGGVGLWSIVVVMPAVETEFGIARAEASLPYSLAMIGFGVGGVAMGRLADRFGIAAPALIGAVLLPLGYVVSSLATAAWQFALVFLVVGFGGSVGLLAADGRHPPLVRPQARHRRRDRRLGQLPRRHDLAARRAACDGRLRLAADASRHRPVLPRDADPAGARHAPPRRRPRRACATARRRIASSPTPDCRRAR